MRSRFAEATGPEVLPEVDVARNGDGAPEPFRGYDGLEVVDTDLPGSGVKTKPENEAAPAIESTTPQKNTRRRRIIWIAVAAVILVVVVVATVVGGVLGSRHHNSAASSRTSSAPSSPSSTPSSLSPNAVASNSSLAVTGWWETTSQYSIRLFYQGKDGQLRMTGYSSNNGKWSTVATYQTDPPLRPGSPLAASCYNSTFYFKNEVNSTSVSLALFLLSSADVSTYLKRHPYDIELHANRCILPGNTGIYQQLGDPRRSGPRTNND